MKQKIKVSSEEQIKRRKKTFIMLIICFLLTLGVGIVVFEKHTTTKSKVDNSMVKKQENVSVIEKEKEKKEDLKKSQEEIVSIQKVVSDILGDKQDCYGIYYCDLVTGLDYSLNPDKKFQAASTIKIPIAMMIAEKQTNNEIRYDSIVSYEQSDYESGAGTLQGSIKVGDTLKVKELLEYMIIESDNIATNMLKRNVDSISSYVSKLTNIDMENSSNILTPRQSGIILKKLYDSSKTNDYYFNIISLMKRTSSHDRLDKYIPKNLVAHKIGDYKECVNDIGIIYTKNPYILCVYTEGVMEEGRENISLISKAIYEVKTNRS